MSVHVMSWVLRHSETKLGDRLVLLVVADHAREDGTGAWPSLETIARQSKLSERQARRCLRNLEAAGEIRQTGKSKSGTHVYEFPRFRAGGDILSGGHIVQEGGTPTSPDPSLEQPSVKPFASSPQKKNGKPPTERQRNEVWDALTDIFGAPTTRKKEIERGKVVAELIAAGATYDEVLRRAKSWPNHYDTATLTPHALDKHWDALGKPPLRRR